MIKQKNCCGPLLTLLHCGNVTSPRCQFLYLMNNHICLKAQNDDECHLPLDNHKQLNSFLKLLTNPVLKQKFASTP